MSLADRYAVGEYFYDSIACIFHVRLEDAKDGLDTWFDCETEYEAQVLSRLILIEAMIKQRTDIHQREEEKKT